MRRQDEHLGCLETGDGATRSVRRLNWCQMAMSCPARMTRIAAVRAATEPVSRPTTIAGSATSARAISVVIRQDSTGTPDLQLVQYHPVRVLVEHHVRQPGPDVTDRRPVQAVVTRSRAEL